MQRKKSALAFLSLFLVCRRQKRKGAAGIITLESKGRRRRRRDSPFYIPPLKVNLLTFLFFADLVLQLIQGCMIVESHTITFVHGTALAPPPIIERTVEGREKK